MKRCFAIILLNVLFAAMFAAHCFGQAGRPPRLDVHINGTPTATYIEKIDIVGSGVTGTQTGKTATITFPAGGGTTDGGTTTYITDTSDAFAVGSTTAPAGVKSYVEGNFLASGTVTADSFAGNGSQLIGVGITWSGLTGNPSDNGSISVTAGVGYIPVGTGSGALDSGWIPNELIRATPIGGIIMYSGAWNFDGTGLGTGDLAGWALCNGNNSTPNLTDRFVLAASASGELGATGGSSSYSLVVSQLPSHTHTFTTNTTGAHTHTIGLYNNGWNSASGSGNPFAHWGGSAATSSDGNHSHSGTSDSTGSGSAIDNRPAFIRLAYIMRWL